MTKRPHCRGITRVPALAEGGQTVLALKLETTMENLNQLLPLFQGFLDTGLGALTSFETLMGNAIELMNNASTSIANVLGDLLVLDRRNPWKM